MISLQVVVVHHLLVYNDILCIQEHWLYSFEEEFLKELLPGLHFHIKCVDDAYPIGPLMKPKGTAGVAIIWNSNINSLITPLQDGSHRCMLVQVGDMPPTFILNTYMPTNGSSDDYGDVLDEVHVIYEKYSTLGEIIWVGDQNGDLNRRKPYENDKLLTEAIHELGIVSVDKSKTPTYHHFVGGITSKIDYMFIQPQTLSKVSKFRIDVRHPLNLSCHDAISATIAIQTHPTSSSDHTSCEAKRRPNWKKIDLKKYAELTSMHLESLTNHGGLSLPIGVLVDRVNTILTQVASECGPAAKPTTKRKNRRTTRYPWHPKMKPVAKRIKDRFFLWKLEDRDPDHPIANELDQCKKELRSMQRQLAAEHRRQLLVDIALASADDKDLYYRVMKKQRGGQGGVAKQH